ncbi:unnamed protein product [Lampetra planeri]
MRIDFPRRREDDDGDIAHEICCCPGTSRGKLRVAWHMPCREHPPPTSGARQAKRLGQRLGSGTHDTQGPTGVSVTCNGRPPFLSVARSATPCRTTRPLRLSRIVPPPRTQRAPYPVEEADGRAGGGGGQSGCCVPGDGGVTPGRVLGAEPAAAAALEVVPQWAGGGESSASGEGSVSSPARRLRHGLPPRVSVDWRWPQSASPASSGLPDAELWIMLTAVAMSSNLH